MKKVLFLSYGEFAPYKGGIASYAKSLAMTFSGHAKITVVGPYAKERTEDQEFSVKRPRVGRWSIARLILGNLYSLYIYLLKTPDYIFVTDQISLSLAKLLLTFKNSSTKIHYFVYGTEIEDIYEGTGHVKKDDFITLLNRFDSIVAISQFVNKNFEKKYPEVSTAVKLVNPAVDLDFIGIKVYDKEAKKVMKKYGLKSGQYVLSVGRLYKRKGHHMVSVPENLKYVVAGTGPEKENLSIMPGIVLTGEVDDRTKKILMENCLFYVHPSITAPEMHQRVEGFGISIIEAFACRKTAVVFGHGGMTEIVKDGINGLVVEEGNKEAMTDAIAKLAEDSELRDKLSEKAYLDYEKKYSQKVFGENAGEALNMKGVAATKPNVTYIVEWFYPIIGGAGKQALLQARHLKGRFRISIKTRMAGSADREGSFSGIPVQRFGPGGSSKAADYIAGLSLFGHLVKNQKNIDIVHIHGNLENNFSFFAVLFSKLFSKPIVGKPAIAGEFKNHLESDKYSDTVVTLKNLNPLNWVRRRLARHLDQYIAISQNIEDELKTTLGENANISFIPNGIEITPLKPKNTNRETVFLVVSRLASHKGILNPLLEVWKTKFKNDKQARLVIVGSGESLSSSVEKEVYQFVKTNELKNVSLEGKRPDVSKYYENADVFILPSENEGLSNSLLEAASYGLVCIVSNASGNTDLVKDNVNGYIFKKGDKEGLEHKMKTAIKEKGRWDEIGGKLKDRVAQGYAIDAVAMKIDDMYKKIFNRI